MPPKGRIKNKVVKNVIEKVRCLSCAKERPITEYYLSNSDFHKLTGRHPVCKTCLKEKLNIDNLETVKYILVELNRPLLYDLWISSREEAVRRNIDAFGLYIKNVNLSFKDLTWKDSVFDATKEETTEKEKQLPNYREEFVVTDEIINKWGDGYSPEEYRAFERKYLTLRNNYQEKTAMHTEALITYIRYRVKEELATASNQAKEAKDWGALAKDAATAAKINPSQLSKSDLSDGLDTFGQLVRYVEQAKDIIPILPRFKERPQDSVDFTIWCYVNYVRDLKGLPLCEYKEIYHFYEQRKREYEEMNKQQPEEDEINGEL